MNTLLTCSTAALLFTVSAADSISPPGEGWVTGYDKSLPREHPEKPAINELVIDPVYGRAIRRISEPNAVSGEWIRHEYSRRQPFNADDSRLVMTGNNGVWHLYQLSSDDTAKWVDKLPRLHEPNWHPTDPDLLRYFPRENPMQLAEIDLSTGKTSVIADFTERLPWDEATYVNTRGEGEPSADGRIWCLMASDKKFTPVGLFSYDLEADTILASEPLSGEPVDHVSTSPSGSYCTPSGAGLEGTWAYGSEDFSERHKLNDRSEHSDVALDAEGRDVLVYTDYGSGWITMVDIATAEATRLIRIYEKSGAAYAAHISGNAYDRPGLVVISTYAATLDYGKTRAGYGDIWGHDRLAILELKPDPKIFNISYMKNVHNGYWTEPHAAVNRDLSRVIFASNWGDGDRPDAYMVKLPAIVEE